MGQIVYFEDIVDKLAEKNGLSKAEVRAICTQSIAHMYSEMMKEDVISISLPNLGTIHLNQDKAKSAIANDRAYTQYDDLLKKQVIFIDEIHKDTPRLVHKRVGIIPRIRKKISKTKEEFLNKRRIDIYNHIEKKQNKK